MSAAPVIAQPNWGRDYGRSMTISQQGIVATSQILASQAGAQMLARGGSAADAAIAANAVLGVVEPMMDGIGGDCFALYWDAKTGKLSGLNASGTAPRVSTWRAPPVAWNPMMPTANTPLMLRFRVSACSIAVCA